MNLTIEQIRSIATGVSRVEERDGAIHLLRFTAEQEAIYAARKDQGFWIKSNATAGVRLEFITDSRTLSIETKVSAGSSRRFFTYEVFCNGEKIGSHGGTQLTDEVIVGSYTNLGEGQKRIRVVFPWSVASPLLRFSLDDGATVLPIKKSCTMLIYGDSITQGYDVQNPAGSYASLLTDALDANAINKGIGGECFRPSLAEASDEIEPDYVTVAYGTNDWHKKEKEVFEENCAAFYQALSRRYPKAKIFAITPIWREDNDRLTKVGSFSYAADYIEQAVKALPNVTVLRGMDFVPKDPAYFSDKYLHPNDEGFAHYFKNLYEAIKQYL
ncbi:MAG: SGNH/GDSL hydrolase family protein [Clostridia bacterium]|nr:SGNH/GDSL hydrolase family protein [Clostridia bacterium]